MGNLPRGSALTELATAIDAFLNNFKTLSLLICPSSFVLLFAVIVLLFSVPADIDVHSGNFFKKIFIALR